MARTGLHRQLLDELSSFNRKLRAVFDAEVKEKGLTLPRTRGLFAVSRRDGLNQRELAEELELETPTVVRLLDAMESQGFIERRSDNIDRRTKQIHLTEFGKGVADDIENVASTLRQKLLGEVDAADIETTLKVIRVMAVNLQDIRSEGDR